jgi:hypothetical protein
MPRRPAETATSEALRRVRQHGERKARAASTCLGDVANGGLTTLRGEENAHLSTVGCVSWMPS